MKFNLSLLDRANLSSLLPVTGSIEEVKKVSAWQTELNMTDEEKEVEASFNQIHDKEEKDKSLNEWYNTKKEWEISEDLLMYLKSELESKESAKAFSFNDPVELYEEILKS